MQAAAEEAAVLMMLPALCPVVPGVLVAVGVTAMVVALLVLVPRSAFLPPARVCVVVPAFRLPKLVLHLLVVLAPLPPVLSLWVLVPQPALTASLLKLIPRG